MVDLNNHHVLLFFYPAQSAWQKKTQNLAVPEKRNMRFTACLRRLLHKDRKK